MSHLGGAILDRPDFNTWMPDVWERLVREYNVRSVLDLGCGAGWATAWFLGQGLRAIGVEGDPAALAARRCDPVLAHDFTKGPLHLVETYDLCWCAEFVEHVEARYMANWMAAMQKCRLVCMTFAHPGQGGYHHVNEQLEGYWIERLRTAGFDHVPEETAKLRATGRGEPWGRPSLTFFRSRMFGYPDPSWLLDPIRRAP